MCGSSFTDTDLDKEGSSDTESSYETDSDCERHTEIHQLLGLVRYLLPMIGPSVWVLKLGCCPMLSNGLVSTVSDKFIMLLSNDLSKWSNKSVGSPFQVYNPFIVRGKG